jgi:hypothetical protein
MSLSVSVHLIEQAKAGIVDEKEFVATIRQSLPYAWGIVEGLAERLIRGEKWANHAVPPPSEQARAQLLRMMGGDAIRGAVDNVAVFRPDKLDSSVYLDFVSIRSQILNQTPELIDC